MGEVPDGVKLPDAEVATPRPSASVVISRGSGEILLGHRVSELPAFPDMWSFPGGGISKIDGEALDLNPEILPKMGSSRLAAFALVREMVEELGFSPDGNGGFVLVDEHVRSMVCESKLGWLEAIGSGHIDLNGFKCEVITERTTPPHGPIRFHNLFFHIDLDDSVLEPSFPPGKSEFDEFRWWDPCDLITAWEEDEVRLPPPIVTLVRDLIEAAEVEGSVQGGFVALSSNPPSGRHRFEFAPKVECILIPTATLPPATHTNCYILGERGGERIIVDPAARTEDGLIELMEKISEIKADDSVIIGTVFTHKHPDHIGDLSAISEIYQAPILASSETLSAITTSEECRVLREGDRMVLQGPNGETIWEVMESNGHCPGQICLIGSSGVICADNCSLVGTILVPSSDGDMNQYISDLYRIRDLSPRLLFPGHGPLVANPERLLSRYIEHREARHNRVLEAVRSGRKKLAEIAKEAYLDTPEANKMLSEDQALSHLKSLMASGVVSMGDDGYISG